MLETEDTFDFGYAAIMTLAVVGGIVLNLFLRGGGNSRELPLFKRVSIAMGALIGASIGAKLPFLVMDFEGAASGAAWFSDGKTIMFGLIGGYAGVEIAKWVFQIRVKTGDGFAVPVAVAVAIGRLACFRGGCCYGVPTQLPWGCQFPRSGDEALRHPTQIYESVFHFSAAVVLFLCLKKGWFKGQLIKLYILSYLVYRFVTEFIRPEPEVWLGLTFYQWAALMSFPVFVLLWVYDAKKFRELGVHCLSETPLRS